MRTWTLWLVVLLLASIAWVFASPVGAVPDEPSHIAYAWGIATGQGVGGPDPTCSEGPCPRTDYDVPRDLIPDPSCYMFDPSKPADCAEPSVANPYPSYMTRYPPPYYLVVGTFLRLGNRIGLTGQANGYVGRFGSVFLSLTLLLPALALVTERGGRAVPYVLAGLVPMAMFTVASVNPSGVEIAAAIAAGASASVLVSHPTVGSHLVFAYSIGWLAWARPIGWIWAGLLFTTIAVLVAASAPSGKPIARLRAALAPVDFVAMAAIFGAFAWFLYALMGRSHSSSQGLTMPDGMLEQWLALVLRWGDLIRESFTLLGWLDTNTPTLLVYASVALIAAMAYIAVARMRGVGAAARVIIAYLVIVVFATIAMMMYQRFLWQGRYVLPALLAGFVLLGVVGDRSGIAWPDRTLSLLASGAWIVSMGTGVWVYLRYSFGLEQGARYLVPKLSDGAAWVSPLGAGGFTLVVLFAMAIVPLTLGRSLTATGVDSTQQRLLEPR